MARMKKEAVLDMAFEHWGDFLESRGKALLLNTWLRAEQFTIDDPDSRFHGRPYYPSRSNADHTDEYDNLASLSPNAWADLVVRSLTQTAHIEGIRMPGKSEDLQVWETMRRNRWQTRQNIAHRTAAGLSTVYGIVLPGLDPFTGDKMSKMILRSPTEMAAWYYDDDDEWPYLAIRATEFEELQRNGTKLKKWDVEIFDETSVHYAVVEGSGAERKRWTYITYEDHPMKVPPVARGCNRLDLDGRATGEIEPIVPLLRRLDQDTFDRLIVQRFGAWKVRYISGMAKPKDVAERKAMSIALRVEDLMVAEDPNAKFGTLDASDPDVYSKVNDADLRMLSAITQTPPHHLLGLSSNLQAEALAAAESGLQRKSEEFRLSMGEFHEQMARMCAMVSGNAAEAAAWDMKVRWSDTESRSLTQAADALGKLAVQLNVPVEMLWERIPGFDDSDVKRAKQLIESGDTIDMLLAEIARENSVDPNAGNAGGLPIEGDGPPADES